MFKSTSSAFAHKLYEALCLKAREDKDAKSIGSEKIEKNLHTRLLSKIFLKEGASDNIKRYEDDCNEYAAKLLEPVPEKLVNRLKSEAAAAVAKGTAATVTPDIWECRIPLQLLLLMLPKLGLENIKHVRTLFCTLITNNFGELLQNFIVKEDSTEKNWVVDLLFASYTAPHNLTAGYALACGQMLRQCIELEKTARDIVSEEHVSAIKRLLQKIVTMDNLKLFMTQALKETNFELLNSAQETFKAMVLSERMGEIMREDNGLRFTEFVYLYEKHLILPTVLSEGYYLVLRESLQLLGDMLLQRHNYDNMMWFIKQKHNLKVFLHLTASKNAKIAFAVFHVLKVFIVNPKKNYCIKRLLYFNKKFLQQSPFFERLDSASDDLVAQEKAMALKQLNDLEDPGEPQFYAVAREETEHIPNIYKSLKELRKSFAKREDGSLIQKAVQPFLDKTEAKEWIRSQIDHEEYLIKRGYITRVVPAATAKAPSAPPAAGTSASGATPEEAAATAGAAASASAGSATTEAAPALPEPASASTSPAAAAGAASE